MNLWGYDLKETNERINTSEQSKVTNPAPRVLQIRTLSWNRTIQSLSVGLFSQPFEKGVLRNLIQFPSLMASPRAVSPLCGRRQTGKRFLILQCNDYVMSVKAILPSNILRAYEPVGTCREPLGEGLRGLAKLEQNQWNYERIWIFFDAIKWRHRSNVLLHSCIWEEIVKSAVDNVLKGEKSEEDQPF